MKEEVFNQYADKIVKLFGIKKDELFSRSRRRDIVDSRQLLYYLCYRRNMKLVTIQKFMENNNHTTNHHTVSHSIKIVEDKIKQDIDYQTIITNIENSVFI